MSRHGVMVRVPRLDELDPRSPSDPARIGEAARSALDQLVPLALEAGVDPSSIELSVKTTAPLLLTLGTPVEYVVRARFTKPTGGGSAQPRGV